jgi:K+-transporting ATPase ATPase A chain
MIGVAGGLAAKPFHPAGIGTLRADSLTFGVMLLGTVLLAGALLFLPAVMLGPVPDYLGPNAVGR